MKTNIELFLPSIYGFASSLLFLDMLINNVHINTLTLAIYFANIIVVYILYRFGGVIDKWLR